jgi:hypothetical protein
LTRQLADHVDSAVAFSRDGTRIAFLRAHATAVSVVVANADGSGAKAIAQYPLAEGFRNSPLTWTLCGLAWAELERHRARDALEGRVDDQPVPLRRFGRQKASAARPLCGRKRQRRTIRRNSAIFFDRSCGTWCEALT